MKRIFFVGLLAFVVVACGKKETVKPDFKPKPITGGDKHSEVPEPRVSGDTLWYDPAEDERFVINGRGWDRSAYASPYRRLPEAAKDNIRASVWNLSAYGSGISIDFVTDASSITVRYKVTKALSYDHMSSTGKSGIDLYADNVEGEPIWCRPRYTFGSTIEYRYINLQNTPDFQGSYKRFRLFLPLYNEVTWMEIGLVGKPVVEDAYVATNKPVVVYGTSITQGAVASRPGMAWTSVLQRNTRLPVVNLGFSDNGHMESDVVDFIQQIDASLFVIDCLPNMINETNFPNNILEQRIRSVYQKLRSAHSNTPILFTQHQGLSDEVYSTATEATINRVNDKLEEVLSELRQEGATNLYMLSKSEIGLCQNCTVDGTHPTDQGMIYIAEAYQNKIRTIFQDMNWAPKF